MNDPSAISPAAARPAASTNNGSVRGMEAPGARAHRPIRDLVSPEEWAMRVDLAACYRLIDMHGMGHMIYNHVTARVPGEPHHFLINPYGYHYSEITASSLHKVDHAGEIVLRANTHYGINHPGFVIHSAVHMARPDVTCVIHTHTQAGVAVSAMKCGLLPISLEGMRFHGHVGYHDCEGTVVDLDERERVAANLGAHNVLVLRNHGLVACGPTVAEAFNTHYMLDLACRIQVDAMNARTELVVPPVEVLERTAHLFQPQVRRPYGLMEWEALLRLLEKRDPSYRE